MSQSAGTFYLETPYLDTPYLNRPYLARRDFQRWLRQVGMLQRAFPNSTLRLNHVIRTADAGNIRRLLSCTELRGITIHPTPVPAGRARQVWRAMASLGRRYSGRLQLHVLAGSTIQMLEAEPSLAAHVSQAGVGCGTPAVLWDADAGSGLADQVSSLSSLTRLMLPGLVLREAGMLDALRQLSALQSLFCLAGVMQTLLDNSVPSSWSLLTKLEVGHVVCQPRSLDWSLVEQQCPQLQALAMRNPVPLCLTALTSLTCQNWQPQDRDCFQCSRLADLHVKDRADPNVLPSTLTSLALYFGALSECYPSVVNMIGDHPNYPQSLVHTHSLVHMSFESRLRGPSDVRRLVPANHPVLSSVTSVELIFHSDAFLPDMDGQHFRHLFACMFPHLQRLHIRLVREGPPAEEVLISAAWLPAHCRLVVTHQLTCPVRVMKCPSGCLSLPLSSRPAYEWSSG